MLEDADQNLTPRLRNLLDQLWQEWRHLDCDIERVSDDIEGIASQVPACQRLRQIPGVGPLVSTATVAAIGNGAAFHQGREFAARLGLIPRQHSTGGKARLLGISKRGSIDLRRMFIHGARAVLLRVKYDTGDSDRGHVSSNCGRRATKLWSPSPTSWHASHGRCSQRETSTGPRQSPPPRTDRDCFHEVC